VISTTASPFARARESAAHASGDERTPLCTTPQTSLRMALYSPASASSVSIMAGGVGKASPIGKNGGSRHGAASEEPELAEPLRHVTRFDGEQRSHAAYRRGRS